MFLYHHILLFKNNTKAFIFNNMTKIEVILQIKTLLLFLKQK